jgi:hypothetical protein
MRDYQQIAMDCELNGHAPNVAARIASMCELEDLWQEYLVTKVYKEKEARSLASDLLWTRSREIADQEEINWAELLIITGEAADIEFDELKQHRNGFERKSNMMLASFLRFYCRLDDDQIFVIANLAGAGSDGFSMGMG